MKGDSPRRRSTIDRNRGPFELPVQGVGSAHGGLFEMELPAVIIRVDEQPAFPATLV